MLEFHLKSVFFFNIFNGDLFFDALILELFYICLVISKREKMNNLSGVICVGVRVGAKMSNLCGRKGRSKLCKVPFILNQLYLLCNTVSSF